MVKNPPAMQETKVRSLGREDPLKKEMAIHSSILAWRIPWAEESDRLQFMGGKESDRTERLILSLSCGRVLPRLWFIIYGHKDDLKSAIKASILVNITQHQNINPCF